MKIVSKPLRDSARGEECTFAIPGVCNHNTETVVLCHLPDESSGMGTKADDISAAYGCHACHDAIDRRNNWPDDGMREWYMRRAMTRTWRRLVDLGIVTIKGVRP